MHKKVRPLSIANENKKYQKTRAKAKFTLNLCTRPIFNAKIGYLLLVYPVPYAYYPLYPFP